MENTLSSFRWPGVAPWRDVVLPKEHGSWSLALEPLVFGLIAAPSVAGGWLAVAVVSAFLARRPLRIAWREARPERRRTALGALGVCGAVSVAALALALRAGGFSWVGWVVPSAVAGALFLFFDLRNGGREEVAEIVGATAFSLLPAALAVSAGAPPSLALALAFLMCARAVPTVMTVRAVLREAKSGRRRAAPALAATACAFAASLVLMRSGAVPFTAVAALGALALRGAGYLVFPRPGLRARTVGMIEAAIGAGYVIVVALACRG